ncbi:MAG: peptidylprolyl isomerase [Acidimicrobiales bacterium]
MVARLDGPYRAAAATRYNRRGRAGGQLSYTWQMSTPCPAPDGTSPRSQHFDAPPPMCIDVSRRYSAEMTTSKGTMVLALDPVAAPKTVNNFVFLARYHYFDGTVFHRVVPGFVLQGGDPTGTGTGGPGYRFEDELPRPGRYELGSLAMANAGPNTNGSQFFIVSGPSGVRLPPQYSLFGKVVSGLDVVAAIDAVGTVAGHPTERVVVESVDVRESEVGPD